MSGDREAVLGRIREALRQPAPKHHEHSTAHVASPVPVTAPFREWLPRVGETEEDRIGLFAQLSAMLKTEFMACTDIAAAAQHVEVLANANGWKTMATHAGQLNDDLVGRLPHSLGIMRIEAGYDRDALEASDAGLTECECLVAQTGSVCVTTLSSGGRTLSVLPPHHIVIARRSQLLADLTSAYELLAQKYAANYPSFITFITGPSRTGDIERILVLGAHGPKKLTVLLVP